MIWHSQFHATACLAGNMFFVQTGQDLYSYTSGELTRRIWIPHTVQDAPWMAKFTDIFWGNGHIPLENACQDLNSQRSLSIFKHGVSENWPNLFWFSLAVSVRFPTKRPKSCKSVPFSVEMGAGGGLWQRAFTFAEICKRINKRMSAIVNRRQHVSVIV